ncbi:MAG: response regulator [Thaumarchaeota archaeon]|nr:response regulator [Nitrososphaerota archaeon]
MPKSVGEKEKTRVLVADDNHDILMLFGELLELKNFDVVGKARNGKEAVEFYNNSRPEISFLDVLMPEGDGIYALEKIREINPNAIVIMVTSDLASATAERLRQLHASAIVYKPFDINEILKVIESLKSKDNLSHLKFHN